VVYRHRKTALIGGFSPKRFRTAIQSSQARISVRGIRSCHTQKPGSWLNIAEHKPSILVRGLAQEENFSPSQD